MFIYKERYMELENKKEGDIKDDSLISGLSNGKMEKQ